MRYERDATLMPTPLRSGKRHIDSGEQSRCKEQNKVSGTFSVA